MDGWILQAIIGGLLLGFYFLQNQNIRLNGVVFMVYRGLVPALILIPFMSFFAPIDSVPFYYFCVLNGLGIAFIDYYYFKAIRFWGAETVTAIQPLNIGITFILWLVLKPGLAVLYLQEPVKFGLIILCLGGISVAMFQYNREKVSRKALKFLLPALVVGALNEVINKLTLAYGAENLKSAVFYYIFLTSLTIGLINLGRYVMKGDRLRILIRWKNLKYCWIFLILIAVMGFRNSAMFKTENPAYVAAFIFLYVVWIMLANNLMAWLGKENRYSQMDKKSAALMLASAVGLILLTGH